ncbi:AGAP004763-PA-like protein [Anopheles sinensis]|uniref:AGAP004763-PA-like protein n=1 Tax=Anopheles sinensis TaxID=74873 RepID=A0A084VZR9_ANOSI|nr:AGAP004763-PA-like protein [Anopheles sinensis]
MSKIRPVSSLLKDVAKRELNEDESQIESHLLVVRTWLAERGLQCEIVDDQFLIAFLRGCKFSLEKVKKKILLFHEIRYQLPQVIQNRDPEDEKVIKVIRMGVAVPLPSTTKPTDPKLFIIRVGHFDTAQCSFADVMKVGTMINDILMREDDQMVICGMILVLDLKGVSAGHLMQLEIELLRKIAILNQDASPLRMQGIHILNPPTGANIALNIFNGLLSEKNRHKRIFSHDNGLESLHQHFSPELLPKEYGGNLESIDNIIKQWENKLKDNRLYLLEMAAMSSKKVSSSFVTTAINRSMEDSFGTDGSFRKLSFD